MSTKTLVIIVIVLVLLIIISTVVGACRPAPKPKETVQQQQQDIEANGTGSFLAGPASWFDWAQPAFPLAQLTCSASITAKRMVTVPAKGTVTITVAKIAGTTVRKLTLALPDPPPKAATALVAVTYHHNGSLPSGVDPSTLPADTITADSPKLPTPAKPPATAPACTCSLAIYPDGAVLTLHALGAQAVAGEVRGKAGGARPRRRDAQPDGTGRCAGRCACQALCSPAPRSGVIPCPTSWSSVRGAPAGGNAVGMISGRPAHRPARPARPGSDRLGDVHRLEEGWQR